MMMMMMIIIIIIIIIIIMIMIMMMMRSFLLCGASYKVNRRSRVGSAGAARRNCTPSRGDAPATATRPAE